MTKRPHIKKETRVREKTKNDYNGDYSRVTDMFAASLIYPDEKSLLATFNKIKNREDVIRIRDRWHKPTVDGYRDIQLNILLSNGAIYDGTFSSITPEDKKRLEDAAAKVPKQKSLRMIELLLSRMEKILEYSLGAEKIAA